MLTLEPIYVDQDIIDTLHEVAEPLGGVLRGTHGDTNNGGVNVPGCALGCLAHKDTGYSGSMYNHGSRLVERAIDQGLTDARNDVVVGEWLRETDATFWATRMPLDEFLKWANIHPKPLTPTE